MMDELLKRVSEKTGLGPDQSKAAVESVLGFLKEKLPAPLAASLDSVIGGGASSGGSSEGGIASRVSAALGNVLGSKG